MKRFLIIGALLFGMQGMAQIMAVDLEPARYGDGQVQIPLTDLIAGRASVEINYSITEEQALGLNLGFYYDMEGTTQTDSSRRIFGGMAAAVFHKIYINKATTGRNWYLRHDVRFDHSRVSYLRTDWFPFERDGNTFLHFSDRTFKYDSYRLGYDLMIGVEFGSGPLILDMSAGVGYRHQLNEVLREEAPSGTNITYSDYNGFTTVGSVRLGYYFD